MAKQAVSVTLDADNLRWLRGQAVATRARGLSEALDRVVTATRLAGRVPDAAIRSVVGSIDISDADPALAGADAHLRALVAESLSRPLPGPAAPRSSRSRPLRRG